MEDIAGAPQMCAEYRGELLQHRYPAKAVRQVQLQTLDAWDFPEQPWWAGTTISISHI